MVKVLITGGAGYIGSMLTRSFLNRGEKVTVLDNFMYKQTPLMDLCSNKDLEIIRGDVRNDSLLTDLVKKHDVIIPLAAIVGFPACENDKPLAKATNTDHVGCIVKNLSKSQVLVYPNTNSGYGVGEAGKFCTEKSPLNPISYYGVSKCEAEKMVLDAGGTALRLATVFGASSRFRIDLLVNDFVYRAYKDKFIVLFEKDFKRNYIHIKDVCRAFAHVVENASALSGEAYNVGLSSANLSKMELCLKIKEYVPGFSIQVDEIQKDPDKRDYIVSNEKFEKTGWFPSKTLDDGIKELLKAYPMLEKANVNFTNL